MHSSTMRTVRCSAHLGEGVCLGGCLPGGCVYLGGVCPGGCPPHRRTTGGPPHPMNRITDRCKIITFPQILLRMVKLVHMSWLLEQNTIHLSIVIVKKLRLVSAQHHVLPMYRWSNLTAEGRLTAPFLWLRIISIRSRFIQLLVIWYDLPINPPIHLTTNTSIHRWGVATNHKSSNRIELSQLGQDLFNF